MKTSEHAEFWTRYDREVRPVVERACRHASRLQSDGTMDPDDMAAWVHTRVWRMLEKNAFPTFHDDPGVGRAIERLISHAPTLARWAYMARARQHWKRLGRETPAELSRVEHLSVTRRADADIEDREAIADALAKVRAALPASVRRKLAASMPDTPERRRAALALGATGPEDDRLMSRIDAGLVKENTVQQMRSRARRHAIEALAQSVRLPMLLAAGMMLLGVPPADAGEQSGGRKGGNRSAPTSLADAEQSGGRQAALADHPVPAQALPARGEQSGGRGGRPG